jgi:hypothetical protein
VRELRKKFLKAAQEGDLHAPLHQMEYASARQALHNAERALQRQEEALGVEENEELEMLVNSEYFRDRMNARALHRRFLGRMRGRKFERDPVKRLGRRLKNGECSVL